MKELEGTISIKDYLDSQFESLKEQVEEIKSAAGRRMDGFENQLGTMNETLLRLTVTVEDHKARSDTLQDMVTPIHKEREAKRIIAEYKAKRRRALKAKLRGPGAIITVLAGTSAFSAWVAYAWEWIMGLFK
jgi:hypothetical protein